MEVEESARRGLSFVIVSDTQGAQPAVPDADVLIHCGNFTEPATRSHTVALRHTLCVSDISVGCS